jgi:hypothetical protein
VSGTDRNGQGDDGAAEGIRTPDPRTGRAPPSPKRDGCGCRQARDAGLERASLERDRQHLELHIIPLLGARRLSQLTAPAVRALEGTLRADRSAAMLRGVIGSLGAILADAQERGLVAQNVVHARSKQRTRGKAHTRRRQKGELQAESTSRRRPRSGS